MHISFPNNPPEFATAILRSLSSMYPAFALIALAVGITAASGTLLQRQIGTIPGVSQLPA